MNFLERWFSKKTAAPPGKLYEPGEVPDSFESLEVSLARLRRYEEILGVQPILRELIDEKLEVADRNLANPLISDQTGQFYRGAYWLAKELFGKLGGLEKEIDDKEKLLTKAKQKIQA